MILNEQDQITADTKKELEEIVKIVRLELYNNELLCGLKVIRGRLKDHY